MTSLCSVLRLVAQLVQCFAREMRGHDRVRRRIVAGEELHKAALGARRNLRKRRRLPPQLDGRGIHHVELGAMQPHVGANLPCQQRMLVRRIVADQQDRRRIADIAHRCRRVRLSRQRRGESREVGGAMVVDVVRAQHQPRELLQQVVLFVLVRFEPITPIEAGPPSLALP